MPKTHATAVWPSTALQIVARTRRIEVAVRMIGSAAPTSAAGTTPTRARPSETEPAMKHGSPSASGSPAIGPATAGASWTVASVASVVLIAGLLRGWRPALAGLPYEYVRGRKTAVSL